MKKSELSEDIWVFINKFDLYEGMIKVPVLTISDIHLCWQLFEIILIKNSLLKWVIHLLI